MKPTKNRMHQRSGSSPAALVVQELLGSEPPSGTHGVSRRRGRVAGTSTGVVPLSALRVGKEEKSSDDFSEFAQ